MFVSSFIRTKYREQTYKDFVARYYKFLPEDVVDLCAEHHLEIHVLYDKIIQQDLQLTKKKLRDYSWAEAESLMSKLGRRCGVWLKTETRGQKTGRRTAVKGGFQSAVTDLKKRWNKK